MPIVVDHSPAGLYMNQASRAGRGDRFMAEQSLAAQQAQHQLALRQQQAREMSTQIEQAMQERQFARVQQNDRFAQMADQRNYDLSAANAQFQQEYRQGELGLNAEKVRLQGVNYETQQKNREADREQRASHFDRTFGATEKHRTGLLGERQAARQQSANQYEQTQNYRQERDYVNDANTQTRLGYEDERLDLARDTQKRLAGDPVAAAFTQRAKQLDTLSTAAKMNKDVMSGFEAASKTDSLEYQEALGNYNALTKLATKLAMEMMGGNATPAYDPAVARRIYEQVKMESPNLGPGGWAAEARRRYPR